MKYQSIFLYTLIISVSVALVLQSQLPLALVALAAFALLGWNQLIEYKSTTKLDPYVRKIELLQDAYEELLKDTRALKETSTQLADVQTKVAQLSMQVATRR